MLTLKSEKRDTKIQSAKLRAKGIMPAVVYGPKKAATSISFPLADFERVWKVAGKSSVVTIEGAGDTTETLIYDVAVHPVTGKPIHADFYAIEKGHKVEVKVPLKFVGTAPSEKLGAVILKVMHEIEIEVEPHQIPHELEIDLSVLVNVNDHVLAKDIKLPVSATLVSNPEDIIVSAAEYREEKIDTEPSEFKEAEVLTAKPEKEGEDAAASEE